MSDEPVIPWDRITGTVRFIIPGQTATVDVEYVCWQGNVLRTMPATKRFVGQPIREVYDWYKRHPDFECIVTPMTFPPSIPRRR